MVDCCWWLVDWWSVGLVAGGSGGGMAAWQGDKAAGGRGWLVGMGGMVAWWHGWIMDG